jgi:hypothetical protein
MGPQFGRQQPCGVTDPAETLPARWRFQSVISVARLAKASLRAKSGDWIELPTHLNLANSSMTVSKIFVDAFTSR